VALPRRAYPEAAPPRPPARQRLARLATEVLAPAPTVVVLLLLVAWRSTPTPHEALAWGVLAALFAVLIPLAYILREVRRRRLSDRHVRVRAQRPLPLLVGIGSVLVGLALATLWVACLAQRVLRPGGPRPPPLRRLPVRPPLAPAPARQRPPPAPHRRLWPQAAAPVRLS
jgi:hypothetical protein